MSKTSPKTTRIRVPPLAKTALSKAVGRPDRQFYAKSNAFGRFGIRWFNPVVMETIHSHGHIEMNWLSDGHMDYDFDGRDLRIPARRLTIFWAGVPHQTTTVDRGGNKDCRQCNIYLPLDAFLYIPHIDRLHETMMGGGVICLDEDNVGANTLQRWYEDYRSGNAERQDILKVEIGAMLRRANLIGWEELTPPSVNAVTSKSRQSAPTQYVVAMLRHILENLSEPLAVDDVAKVAGLHPNYALNLFTSVMRVPIRKFVVRMRLVRARSLLFESNLSIENIAFQSGFTSLSQFYAHFKRGYGITPLEMRKLIQ